MHKCACMQEPALRPAYNYKVLIYISITSFRYVLLAEYQKATEGNCGKDADHHEVGQRAENPGDA